MRKMDFLKNTFKCGVLSSNLLNCSAMENNYKIVQNNNLEKKYSENSFKNSMDNDFFTEIHRKVEKCNGKLTDTELKILTQTKFYKLQKLGCYSELLQIVNNLLDKTLFNYSIEKKITILSKMYEYLNKSFQNRSEIIINEDFQNEIFKNSQNKKIFNDVYENITLNCNLLKNDSRFKYFMDKNNLNNFKNDNSLNDFIDYYVLNDYIDIFNFNNPKYIKNDITNKIVKDIIINTDLYKEIKEDVYNLLYNASEYKKFLNKKIFLNDFIIINNEDFKSCFSTENFNNKEQILSNIYSKIIKHLKEKNNNCFEFEIKENGNNKKYFLFFNCDVNSYIPIFKCAQNVKSVKIHKCNIKFESLFKNCTNLESVEILEGSQCCGSLRKTFYNCNNLRILNFNNLRFNRISDFESMCENCFKLKKFYFPKNYYPESINDGCNMDRMFANCNNLKYIFNGKYYNTEKAKSLNNTFLNCDKLNLFTEKDNFNYSILHSLFKNKHKYNPEKLNDIHQLPFIKIEDDSVKTTGIFEGKNKEEYNKKFNIKEDEEVKINNRIIKQNEKNNKENGNMDKLGKALMEADCFNYTF